MPSIFSKSTDETSPMTCSDTMKEKLFATPIYPR